MLPKVTSEILQLTLLRSLSNTQYPFLVAVPLLEPTHPIDGPPLREGGVGGVAYGRFGLDTKSGGGGRFGPDMVAVSFGPDNKSGGTQASNVQGGSVDPPLATGLG